MRGVAKIKKEEEVKKRHNIKQNRNDTQMQNLLSLIIHNNIIIRYDRKCDKQNNNITKIYVT